MDEVKDNIRKEVEVKDVKVKNEVKDKVTNKVTDKVEVWRAIRAVLLRKAPRGKAKNPTARSVRFGPSARSLSQFISIFHV